MDREATGAAVIVPLGGQDLGVRSLRELGPFPDPRDFAVAQGLQSKVGAREWGLACVAAVRDLSPRERQTAVYRYLDAPILGRVLAESVMTTGIARLVFVVTDQDPPQQHDTLWFGEILRDWTQGMVIEGKVSVGAIDQPIVIRNDPHLLPAVLRSVAPEARRVTRGCREVAVVQAGGTPAMSFGALLAFVLTASLQVRHLQVPMGQPVVEVALPALIERARVIEAARRLLQRRDPAGAEVVLQSLADAGAERARRSATVAGLLQRRQGVTPELLNGWADGSVGAAMEGLMAIPALTRHIRLAAWEALHGWRAGDDGKFLSLLMTISEQLPAHWFLANGTDYDNPATLKTAFEGADWEAFANCRNARGRGKQTREEFVRRNPPVAGAAVAMQLFLCHCWSKACTCGVARRGRARLHRPGRLLPINKAARTWWDGLEDSRLSRLRNDYQHGLAPIPRDTVVAGAEFEATDEGVTVWLSNLLSGFGVLLGSDLVELLCADAERELSPL